jgi:hypothetical protein
MEEPMARDWESWLQTAARPASATEEAKRDRTEQRIREAIQASREIPSSVRVYVKGSYKTNTNVRQDADVDVCVEWTDFAYVGTLGRTVGMGPAELRYTASTNPMTPTEFRARVERALVRQFGSALVDTSGDKAIDVEAGSNTLDADVVPCFEMHRYDGPGSYVVGQRLFPKSGGWIDNFPQQNYDNGVKKNSATNRRYKQIVRCIKRLEGEMFEEGWITREYPGYLIECLVYNVPNWKFGNSTLYADMQAVLDHLLDATSSQEAAEKLEEVNELLWIFRGRPDRIPKNAHTFIDTAWRRINE